VKGNSNMGVKITKEIVEAVNKLKELYGEETENV
jgi:hypothetical protein